MREKFLFLFGWMALLVVAVGCTSVAGAGSLQIRIANRSGHDFERVVVTFPADKVDYGRVRNGESTDFQPVREAYRYARIEVAVGEKSITFQPQDYLGEEPLSPGKYTYVLEIDGNGNNLKLKLITE